MNEDTIYHTIIIQDDIDWIHVCVQYYNGIERGGHINCLLSVLGSTDSGLLAVRQDGSTTCDARTNAGAYVSDLISTARTWLTPPPRCCTYIPLLLILTLI